MARTGRPRQRFECSVEGCERIHTARGYCHEHYGRWVRTGGVSSERPIVPRERQKGDCFVDGCERPAITRQMCNTHYLRWRKGKPLNVPIRSRSRNGEGSRWIKRYG